MKRWPVFALPAVMLAGALSEMGDDGGASAAAPKIYVGLFRDNAVAVVDSASRQVIATIPVPRGPHGLVITPDGRKVYVSSDGDSAVSVIDTAIDRLTGTIEVGPNPHGLAIGPDGRVVLVSAWGANRALLIDTASDRVVAGCQWPSRTTAPSAPMGEPPGWARRSRVPRPW